MCRLTVVNQISSGTIYQSKMRRTQKIIFGQLSNFILWILSYAIVKCKLKSYLFRNTKLITDLVTVNRILMVV